MTADEAQARVGVAIHAHDPLASAALTAALRGDPRLTETGLDPRTPPDVVTIVTEVIDRALLELLPALDGRPEARFLVIADAHRGSPITAAVAAGVRAVLWRGDFTPARFTETVLAVAGGDGMLPPELQGALIEQVQWTQREILAPRGLSPSGMTDREIDVLRMLADGLELAEIARKLAYSERTVKNVLYGVMRRFQLRNRTHAVAYAHRAGLI
jgi:DNA-binding NarL/FixJ family response regulator